MYSLGCNVQSEGFSPASFPCRTAATIHPVNECIRPCRFHYNFSSADGQIIDCMHWTPLHILMALIWCCWSPIAYSALQRLFSWLDEQLRALLDSINWTGDCVALGLLGHEDLVVIATLRVIHHSHIFSVLKTCAQTMTTLRNLTEAHEARRTSKVLSPKKWMSENSSSTKRRQ